ncbi:MAG TPA: GNAT family protein [Candidatus Limnocylindrales bacterium]
MDDTFDRLLTERLVLRRFTPGDAARFAAYRSDPMVARYQSWDAPYPLERAEAFVGWLAGRHPDEPGEWFQLAIAERSVPDVLVGDCGFRSRPDDPAIVDVGFTLAPAAQGRGLATEAIGELLRYLFEERVKHKVCADCDTRNQGSWRLLERLGFEREGTLRESYREGQEWADEYLYGLLARDWRGRRGDFAGVR